MNVILAILIFGLFIEEKSLALLCAILVVVFIKSIKGGK
jgi:hypothetical protein